MKLTRNEQLGQGPIPSVYVDKKGRVISSVCTWCLQQTEPSRSHLFADFLGGRFVTYISCKTCNNFLGHNVEWKALRNAFLTQAVEKLGLSDSRGAYRHAKVWDQETGLEMWHNEHGGVSPIPKPIAANKFVGTPEDRASYFTKRAKKRNPEIDVTPLEEFFRQGKTGRFSLDGYTYSTIEHPEAMVETRIEGLTRDPSSGLVFKIAYEFMAMLNLLKHSTIGPTLQSFVKRDELKPTQPFEISNSVSDYVVSNTDVCFRSYRHLIEVPFERYHHTMLRVTPGRMLWCEVGFFTQIQSWFLLGRIESCNSNLLTLLDRAFVFPIDDSGLDIFSFPNLLRREYYCWVNEKLDLRVSELNSMGIPIPNL